MSAPAINTVEIDPPRLDAEADTILREARQADPPAPPVLEPGAPAQAPALSSWAGITEGGVVLVDIIVLPQWNLTEREKEALTKATADVLEQLFPGGMDDPRWAPWVRLLSVSVAITMVRRDPATGKFPPIGRPAPPPAPASTWQQQPTRETNDVKAAS